MKKYIPIIFVLALIKFIIQWIGNHNYGFHRDELLHLSVSEHLAWGFMEFPPFIAFIGKLSYWLFDYHILGVRLFSTLAGVSILILCCLMAKELGGKFRAVLLAGICVLAFIPFYRNHTLFQPVAFDQLFWVLGFYFLIKFVNSKNKKFLILLGITLGFGLLNKYTMLVWALGIFVGLLFYNKARLFKNKWLYISGIISLLMFLPNIIWQFQNDFPLLRHMQRLNESQLEGISLWSFILDQLEITPPFILFLCGFIGLFFSKKLREFKFLGISCLVIFATMWFMGAKTYYIFPLYPVLFSAGAVFLESLFVKRPNLVYVIAVSVLLPMIYFIPEATPILPIDAFVEYRSLEEEDGRIELTGDYADMFGWEEQAKLVDSVYNTLTAIEKDNCVLWAENYGEAGALKILGKQYNLPNPISRHGSFWTWGFGNKNAKVWISLGNEEPAVDYVFEDVELVKIITHKYAIGEEHDIPLYICRNPKVDIEAWWKAYEPYIFD
ncbi:ArnT family glycosyltransferase [Winogradskyella flava]|uniref:Glycosyltransferase family 39 protein n=1 Tax=Winogradskyella flava TaxID=1884876 RepID=A0A842IWT7_9FLAO|nr:glycosyltransferase family 39 protein [Winogradskyella flava]MBC2846156.1 glycosyltransferase family 39 protein [Winogradskyella flava]